MKNYNRALHRWFFVIAGLIYLVGLIISLIIFMGSNIRSYPAMITEAYQKSQHHLTVPGEKDIKLERSGAYGIYYIYKMSDANDPEIEIPPSIICTLTYKANGEEIHAVPDYVKTNRYRASDQNVGVLIMSITVDEPGFYTLSCRSKFEKNMDGIKVALGPNYFWEFLQIAWKISGSLLAGVSILCGSSIFTFVLMLAGAIFLLLYHKKSDVL